MADEPMNTKIGLKLTDEQKDSWKMDRQSDKQIV